MPASVVANHNVAGPTFINRPPSFRPTFPTSEAFHQALDQPGGVRRLRATSTKPARTHYIIEQAGHHFEYELGRTTNVQRIFNVDKEPALVGIACEERRLQLLWGPSIVAHPPRLHPGDLVAGSREWQCVLAGGFLREVMEVDVATHTGGNVTAVVTRDVAPLDVFRDLYIDLRWSRSSAPRRLQDNGLEFVQALPNQNLNI